MLVQRLLRCTGVNGIGPGFHDTVFSQHQDEAFRENTMAAEEKPKIPLPKDWTGIVRSAVLNVIGLAQYATAYTPYGQFIQPNISTEKTRALKLGKLYNLN